MTLLVKPKQILYNTIRHRKEIKYERKSWENI